MDNHLLIKDVKIGYTIGHICHKCGEKTKMIITGFVFENNDGLNNWLYCLNIEGTPKIFLSNHDIYNELYSEVIDCNIANESIDTLQGIKLDSYNFIEKQLLNTRKNEALLVKLLMYLDLLDDEQIKITIEKVKNHYLDELDFI